MISLPETYKALVSQGPGENPKIEDLPLPKPGKNEVLVKIEFAPINPSDIAMMRGLYSNPYAKPTSLTGLEGSGTVVAVGEDLKLPAKEGDRVHVIGPGTMGQYLLTTSENCLPILQPDLPFEQAACHLVNPGTVIYMSALAERGGHKCAIHTVGASALGRMMIKYFKHKGIKLINIVRKDEQIDELKAEGADFVLNSQAPDFENTLKELAEKEGATIAFEAIAGDMTNKVFKAQPPGSICYVYGGLAGRAVTNIDITEFFKKKTMTGLYLSHYVVEQTKAGEIGKFFAEIHSLLPTIFKTNIQKVFKLEEVQEALAYYKENSSKGKILLKPN